MNKSYVSFVRDGGPPPVPLVRERRRDAGRSLPAAPADEQRKMRLHGNRLTRRVDDRVVLAFEGRAFVVEQRAHDRARLLEAIEPGTGVEQLDAVRLVLVHLPSGAETEHHPTVADVVDARGDLRQYRGM